MTGVQTCALPIFLRRVYLPASFSQIVTGLITAAGGAWNGCIVAEYVVFRGQVYTTNGLGAFITKSTESGNFDGLVAAVCIMIVLIVLLNRLFWAKLYELTETKYRLDG